VQNVAFVGTNDDAVKNAYNVEVGGALIGPPLPTGMIRSPSSYYICFTKVNGKMNTSTIPAPMMKASLQKAVEKRLNEELSKQQMSASAAKAKKQAEMARQIGDAAERDRDSIAESVKTSKAAQNNADTAATEAQQAVEDANRAKQASDAAGGAAEIAKQKTAARQAARDRTHPGEIPHGQAGGGGASSGNNNGGQNAGGQGKSGGGVIDDRPVVDHSRPLPILVKSPPSPIERSTRGPLISAAQLGKLHFSSVNALNAAQRHVKDTLPWSTNVIFDSFQARQLQSEVERHLGNQLTVIATELQRHPESCALVKVDIVRGGGMSLTPWRVAAVCYEGMGDRAVNRVWKEFTSSKRRTRLQENTAAYFVCYSVVKGRLVSTVISQGWLKQSVLEAAQGEAEPLRVQRLINETAAHLSNAEAMIANASQQQSENSKAAEEAMRDATRAEQVARNALQVAADAKASANGAAAKAEEAKKAAEAAASR
jgi:hypothetical protein